MESTVKLNEAFTTFTRASQSLEKYYGELTRRVEYLTRELESKNNQLRRAVSEVGEWKDYLQAVLQSMSEAIIVLDQDERVTMMNAAAEELLEEEAKGLQGLRFDELGLKIHENSSGSLLKVKEARYDVIISRSTVHDMRGEVRGYVILIQDITRLRDLERQQERNMRLVAMGEMAAKIVHEIRSPLCSIELYSNMLSGDLQGSRHSDMAQGISTGIKSLNNILNNMLFFAKPHKAALKTMKIGDALDESLRILLPLAEIRNIKVKRQLGEEVIRGDAELLKQVFTNVMLNAMQAMPGGGEMRIWAATSTDHIILSIADEGNGIDPDLVEKMFDPFFSTKEKGTGLGLTIAHTIMQSHEGFIRARLNQDRGSTFSLYFCRPGELPCEDEGEE